MDIIEVDDLSWRYLPLTDDGHPIRALDHISLGVREGEFISVVGATGAGKSTLCLALTGLIPNSIEGFMDGRVLVHGQDTNRCAVADIARNVGYVQQEPRSQLFSVTVEDEIAFPLENLGVPQDQMERRITEALTLVSMNEFRQRKPTSLSGGQMQRVALAAALVGEPDVLILDEPTAALDPLGKEEVFSALDAIRAQRSLTIIMVEQEVDQVVRSSDRIIVMDQGHVIAQGGTQLFADEPGLFLDHGIAIPEACEIALMLNEAESRRGGDHAYRFIQTAEVLRSLSAGSLLPLGERQ